MIKCCFADKLPQREQKKNSIQNNDKLPSYILICSNWIAKRPKIVSQNVVTWENASVLFFKRKLAVKHLILDGETRHC